MKRVASELFGADDGRVIRVLAVDDDEVNRRLFERAVTRERLPYEVSWARSVAEAGSFLAREKFDVVVTDYSLGDGTAFDVARRAPNLPLIIVTGSGDEAVAIAALRSGASDYIVKRTNGSHLKVLPFSIDAAVRHHRAGRLARMLSHAMKNVLDAVYITDLDGHFLFANAAFERIYGHDARALVGLDLGLLAPEVGCARAMPAPDEMRTGWVGEVLHTAKSGVELPIWLSRSYVDGGRADTGVLVFVARDMTERRRLEDALLKSNQELAHVNQELERSRNSLAEMAIRDELTGLYNRRELNRVLDDESARCERSGQPLSLILLDVDHFKRVNDEHGHLAGDDVLRMLGRIVVGVLRRVDRAARFGGEELAIVLPDTPAADAVKVAERVRQLVSGTPFALEAPHGGDTQLRVTASLGVAALDDKIRTREHLLQRADEALYRAKAEGRNRTICLASEVRKRAYSARTLDRSP